MPAVNYLWDPVEDNIVQELDDSGTTVADYTREPFKYGNAISQSRAGNTSHFHYDGLGSSVAVTDASQQITDSLAYTAYGEVVERTGSTIFPFFYVGRKGYYRDSETVDYAVRRRTFCPSVSRWLSPDPSERMYATHYAYCSAPTQCIDPSGLVDVSFDPPSPESMPWVKVLGLTLGGVGKTHAAVSVSCGCSRTGRLLPRRRCELKCSSSATFTIYVFKEMIECVRDLANPECQPWRDALEEAGLPLPTVEGTYGHEQRHVESMQQLLLALASELRAYEGFTHCCICDELAARLTRYGQERVALIEQGEAHGTTGYPTNPPPSPDDGRDYPPIGEMPSAPTQRLPELPSFPD